jgi:rhamnosyltransferase subunit B
MTQKTILLCTLGSAGDVNPFIAIGQGLVKRGFRVFLITSVYFESQARAAGLGFFGIGTLEHYQAVIQNPDLWDPDKGFKVFSESVTLPSMQPLYEIISGFDPLETILISPGQIFGARIAHEKLGFPLITIHLQPAIFRSIHDFPLFPPQMPRFFRQVIFALLDTFMFDKVVAPEINRFRHSLSLPSIKKVFNRWIYSPQKNIGLFPEWFGQPQPDWPPQTQVTNFVLYDKRSGSEDIPPELDEFLNAGDLPILFTPGTAMKHADRFFIDCIDACQILGRRGILLTQFPEQLPGTLPPGIRHFTYLPFSKVLPRMLAFVHHGGIGTIAQAIAAGIPQVMRPMAHDQPDNAARVEKLGIGVSLSPQKFNANSLAQALNVLITSPEVLARCKTYAKRMHPGQDLENTCVLIENFANEHLVNI